MRLYSSKKSQRRDKVEWKLDDRVITVIVLEMRKKAKRALRSNFNIETKLNYPFYWIHNKTL